MGEWYDRPRPIDLRYIDGDPFSRQGNPADGQRVWMRADGELPDDPTLHACIVTYASDMTLLDTTVLPFGLSWDSPGMQMASLDHAMWFHRPFRADDWLLYDQQAISTGGARGLAGGAIFTADGTLAVTVVQEGLARVGSAVRPGAGRCGCCVVLAPALLRRRVAPTTHAGADGQRRGDHLDTHRSRRADDHRLPRRTGTTAAIADDRRRATGDSTRGPTSPPRRSAIRPSR